MSILNSRIKNSIASIPILPLVTSSDRIEDVGHRVYLTIQELLRAVVDAQLFPLIVAINFDYHAAWIHQCRSASITFKSEYETERIKMESHRQFINAYDALELSKKNQNDAISQLRALEHDV